MTRTAASLTMPTDEGDDQFETIQQEFQVGQLVIVLVVIMVFGIMKIIAEFSGGAGRACQGQVDGRLQRGIREAFQHTREVEQKREAAADEM